MTWKTLTPGSHDPSKQSAFPCFLSGTTLVFHQREDFRYPHWHNAIRKTGKFYRYEVDIQVEWLGLFRG